MVDWLAEIPERQRDGLLLVVDGGATRSRVAVVGTDGSLVAHVRGGPTNARSVGSDVAAANLATAVGEALAAAGSAGEVVYALVTSAAVDTLDQSRNLSDAVSGHLPEATVVSLPDPIGCWAATNSLGPAVGVIAGTGSVVVVADRDRGLWQRYGGWDFILGDEGSGYALGRAALREAMLVGEGRSDARVLHDAVLASPAAVERGVTTAEGLPDAVHQDPIDKAWIASFAEVLLDLADGGDGPSAAIVAREVTELAEAVVAGVELLARTEHGDDEHGDDRPSGSASPGRVAVGLFGGTFRSPALHRSFVEAVSTRTTVAVDVGIPPHTALVGAFVLALGADPAVGPAELATAADRLSGELAGE